MAQQRRGGRKRRKVDYIAANHIEYIDYKDIELLKDLFQNAVNLATSCNWYRR